ncbi:MAG: LysR family transcriptional regulator [Bacteroidales bacterium]|nr:LysR family transcriptional regulator [Bacteroidales bacterium]
MDKINAEVFVTVANLGSFKKAADKLGYTQAGISYIINSMEEQAGFRLFEREFGGVRLTQEGQALVPAMQRLYRYEQSGELHGLTRVRGFTQDDAHLFVRPDQLKEEFCKVIDIVLYIFKTLNFDQYTAQVSLRDPNNREKYIGTDENWERAESAIIEAAKEKGLNTVVEYGEAAFYGPKLDFMVKDAIGRKWQLGTIQVDYNLPERFDLEYTGADDKKYRPIMIHRAPFGSMERFVAVLLEHTGGRLPLWLAPDQVVVLPVSEKYNEFAKKVCNLLNNCDIRASIDDRNETIGKKIRENELKRMPYQLIVGEKEAAEDKVSVRKQGGEDLGVMGVQDFASFINEEIKKQLSNN